MRRLKTLMREKAQLFQSLGQLGGSIGGIYRDKDSVQIPDDLKALKPIKQASG
jgi:hypothetical protein